MMWRFVKLPALPDKPERHVAMMTEYRVQETQEVTPGTIIAIVRARTTSYAIRTTRRARVKKTIFEFGTSVGIGDPIAVLDLFEDPFDDTSAVECITIESHDPNVNNPLLENSTKTY